SSIIVSRRASESSARDGTSSKSTRHSSPRRTESLDDEQSSQRSRASTSNPSSEPRTSDARPVTASHIAMTVTPARHLGKFVRSPVARALTPPEDVSFDGDEETSLSSAAAPSGVKNNKDAMWKRDLFSVENLSGLLERPVSMTTLSQTLNGLAHPYSKEATKGQEDVIFDLFKIPGKNEASIGRLLTVLKSFGLRMDDPRLKPMMKKLKQIEKQEEERMDEVLEPKHWKLNKDQFKECVAYSLDLIVQTLQNNLVIPSWATFVEEIRTFYSEVSFGDSKTPFCVQSVSKTFNYAIAASDLGADYVHSYVGQEPSGRFFNEICLDSKNKPHNPMVNSGAIIVTALIKNTMNMADRFDHVITEYRKIAGGEYIGFNNATFLSERATADRNYALSYYMKEKKCFPPETTSLTDAIDFYFQLCSIEGNCESLSVMAATLANGGWSSL
ncbi:unnamed protein product, partial [Heligmosomoides polygyrus]|uniref:glutaminase n=1 Tax=Heligmosomoides polygyrus TaxID=6339 RepID=A0A183FZ76_HELPZ